MDLVGNWYEWLFQLAFQTPNKNFILEDFFINFQSVPRFTPRHESTEITDRKIYVLEYKCSIGRKTFFMVWKYYNLLNSRPSITWPYNWTEMNKKISLFADLYILFTACNNIIFTAFVWDFWLRIFGCPEKCLLMAINKR